jgi:hypothetical protein
MYSPRCLVWHNYSPKVAQCQAIFGNNPSLVRMDRSLLKSCATLTRYFEARYTGCYRKPRRVWLLWGVSLLSP